MVIATTLSLQLTTAVHSSAANAPGRSGREPRGSQDATPDCPPNKQYQAIDGNHAFRIWYLKTNTADEKQAKYLVHQMDSRIWPMLTDLMNVKPKADPQEICLLPLPNGAGGDTHPVLPRCDDIASDVLIDRGQADIEARDDLAHEFMHALQYTLDIKCKVPGAWWWRETTGAWAEEYVYPYKEFPQDATHRQTFIRNYLEDVQTPLPEPDQPAAFREYGAYLFPLFLEHKIGPHVISAVWHAAENDEGVLGALNSAIPGGMKKRWPQFALSLWNEDPTTDLKTWDGITDGEAAFLPAEQKFQLDPTGGSHEDSHLIPVEVKHLSAKYEQFTFAPGTRTVTFVNATHFVDGKDKDARVQAIIDVNGAPKRIEDLTGKAGAAFCLDQSDEDLKTLTLIFSNSGTKASDDITTSSNDKHPQALVAATDAGCRQWSGTIHAQIGAPSSAIKQQVTVNFTAEKTFPTDFGDGENFFHELYLVTSATGSWSISGHDDTTECSDSGSGSFPLAVGTGGILSLGWTFDVDPGSFHQYGWTHPAGWDPKVTYQETCPDPAGSGGTVSNSYEEDISDYLVPFEDSLFTNKEEVNGLSINGSETAQPYDTTWGHDQTTWTWTLTSSG